MLESVSASDRSAVGGILSKARLGLGYTQRELAVKCGVPQADISRIERGEGNHPLRTLARVADAVGLELRIEARPRF